MPHYVGERSLCRDCVLVCHPPARQSQVTGVQKKRTGIQLTPAESTAWDAAYSRFVAGKIDILYGANDTPERKRPCALRRPHRAIRMWFWLSKRVPDRPWVTWMASVWAFVFSNQNLALAALKQDLIDACVTSGGGVEVEYLVNNPNPTASFPPHGPAGSGSRLPCLVLRQPDRVSLIRQMVFV